MPNRRRIWTAWDEHKDIFAWFQDSRCTPGLSKNTFYLRINRGLSVEEALTRSIVKGKHGDSGGDDYSKRTRLYGIWLNMRGRCKSKNPHKYATYGAKGIQVCSEWDSFESFKTWAIANGYTDTLSIDRKDGNKNYAPDNCRWATILEQQQNLKSNRYLTAFGETKILAEWLRDSRCVPGELTLHTRLRLGWDFEKALITPVRSRKLALGL